MTLMNITMIIFSVVETVFKNFMFKYLHQILCILMHILMLLKLDNSSDCVDTSLVGNVTGSGALLKCLGNINVCSVECVV